MKLDQFIKETFEEKYGYCHRPRIYCIDGFNFSVQGSSGHYCTPRETINFYYEMEIGYPSEKEESILEYAEQPEQPTETVYGYVPCYIIQEIIDNHGGIDIEKTFTKKH